VNRPSVQPLLAALLASLLLPAAAAAGDKVGPEACKACHPAAYDTWRAGPHARGADSLSPQGRKDPRCLSCHAPDLDDGVAGVSCEACHGPGRVYSAPYVMRDPELAHLVGLAEPGEKACLACHGESAPSLVRFEYVKKLPLIDHWSKERKAAAKPAERPAPGGR
jgi:Cytochrome c554 and c-prime